MTLPHLNLIVPEEGYSFADPEAVFRAQLSSGPSRLRLDMLDAPIMGQVQLVLEPAQYQYWRAFYRSTIQRGAFPFTMDLVIDSAELAAYEVKMIPGSMTTGRQGFAYMVGFSIEVKISPQDTAYDDAIVLLYGIYGDSAPSILYALDHLINVDFPGFA